MYTYYAPARTHTLYAMVAKYMTGYSIFSMVHYFDRTMAFYWSYTLLLKPPVLMCSCYSIVFTPQVNGIDLRHATQAEAVNILNLASNPVRVLLQSQSERLRPAKFPPSHIIEDSPEHSHHNSWAIEEEEDAKLREEFPDVDGHLFEVKLNKGNSGLGLSIVANTNAQSVKGIVIMGIQLGGVADQSGRIKWGDMILKVNETCVIGMSQQQVQELLAKAPPVVRFVLVRQHTGIQQKVWSQS